MANSAPPTSIRAGETISYVASKYSAEDYTLQVAFNNGVDAPLVVDGEADETQFNVITEAPSKPGRYTWAEVYTDADGAITYGPSGFLEVLPSLLTQATPSFAAKMVAKLRAVLEMFAATDKQSVSFDGQSFTRASIREYQEMLTIYESRLNAELRGGSQGGFIRVTFAPPPSRFFP